jgi:hypothetical protein
VSQEALQRGRSYLLKSGAATVPAVVDSISATVDIATGTTQKHAALASLALNEIGIVILILDRRLALDPYRDNRATGGFILIDRISNDTVAMGLVETVGSFAADLVNESYASMEGIGSASAKPAPIMPVPSRRDPLLRLSDAAVPFAGALIVLQAPLPSAFIALASALVHLCLRYALAHWRSSKPK